MRRITLVLVAAVVAGLALLATPASAQEGSPPSVAGLEIERPAPEVQGVSTARTGSETMPMVLISGGLLVVGAALVLGARRRQTPAIVRTS